METIDLLGAYQWPLGQATVNCHHGTNRRHRHTDDRPAYADRAYHRPYQLFQRESLASCQVVGLANRGFRFESGGDGLRNKRAAGTRRLHHRQGVE